MPLASHSDSRCDGTPITQPRWIPVRWTLGGWQEDWSFLSPLTFPHFFWLVAACCFHIPCQDLLFKITDASSYYQDWPGKADSGAAKTRPPLLPELSGRDTQSPSRHPHSRYSRLHQPLLDRVGGPPPYHPALSARYWRAACPPAPSAPAHWAVRKPARERLCGQARRASVGALDPPAQARERAQRP